MEKIVNDPVFGQMIYKRRWFKKISLSLFNKDWTVTLVAKAFSGKDIADEQRKSYSLFLNKEKQFEEKAANLIKNYINNNCEDLSASWSGAHNINSTDELINVVKPTTLIIKQDGTTVLLLNCPWDEHGLAIQFIPDIIIGSQDVFL